MTRLFAIVLIAAFAGQVTSESNCFCTSDQPCWPSPEVFSQLESQLSQPLVYPVPTAYPCYPPSDPSGNCTEVQENWKVDLWRTDLPGSMQAPNLEEFQFQNGTWDACFLDANITGTCGQGSVPVIGVDVRSIADIQAAVKFAVEHRLKLVVKNTGHDYIGRSNARGSFVVWTHNMKDMTYNDVWAPQGAPAGQTFEGTLTVGAGVQWTEADTFGNENGRLVVSGGCGSVGSSGGWLQGGGHSPMSPTYGLGVDNALEMSIVLSSGEYLVTNEYQNADLFWALRGGGGGTYGIVTSVTYQTHPMVTAQKWEYSANSNDSSVVLDLVKGYMSYQSQFTNAGWGGYGGTSSSGISFIYWAPAMTNETAKEEAEAWQNYVKSLALPGVVSTSTTTFYSTWFDTISEFLAEGEDANVGSVLAASRLLSPDVIEANGTGIAQLLIECNAEISTVAGGKVNQIEADSVGLTPAWRTAVVHPVCWYVWNETATPAEVEGVVEKVKSWTQRMHDLTPGRGAYLNEASPYEIDWQFTFFGDHYDKLKEIKNKYDPVGLFIVHEGVGSDEWDSTFDLSTVNSFGKHCV